ncbi:META domain-containing protein [Cryptosporangium aurantiacum]|uniref:Heat shock protein HslJ n=1 Tax=Cryptosporangium aurantiacum TaxID=134849 RepID=A0A1M7PTY5_9ACTN|nr:META domain-containing protein [Cryptosporangium aurantiacum]SHN20861.1 heat shock protein HslJ [Cryptosporangium aurantiacum]
MTRIALLFLLVFAAAACGPAQGESTTPGDPAPTQAREKDPLTDTAYRSVAVTEDGEDRPPAVEDKPVEVRFGANGTLVFRAACNRIEAPYTLEGNRVRVGQTMTTDMACAGPRMAEDQWFTEFFQAEPVWKTEGRTLVLTTERAEIRLEPLVVPSPPILGARWNVTGLVSGDSVSSVPQGVEAYLAFGHERVTGSTGCNRLSGPMEPGISDFRFGAIVTTKMACGDAANAVERAVLEVLNAGTVRFTQEGRTMRLTAGEKGLVLEGS